MDNTTKAGVALGCSFSIVLVIVPLLLFLDKSSVSTYTLSNNVFAQEWNIIEYFYGKENIEVVNDVIKVKYAKGSFQDAGGFKFYAAPRPFPCYAMCLSYEVLFASAEWVKGGKLPGVWLGDVGASGGRHIGDGYSIRIMWRADGDAEVYLYIPGEQNENYKKVVIANGVYGDSLWRGDFKFFAKEWNTITMCIHSSLQSKIEVKINNVTKGIKVNLNNTIISGIMMHSFYGGNDESWAPSVDSFIYFKDFAVWQ